MIRGQKALATLDARCGSIMEECGPVTIKEQPGRGRSLVAARDLTAGEQVNLPMQRRIPLPLGSRPGFPAISFNFFATREEAPRSSEPAHSSLPQHSARFSSNQHTQAWCSTTARCAMGASQPSHPSTKGAESRALVAAGSTGARMRVRQRQIVRTRARQSASRLGVSTPQS